MRMVTIYRVPFGLWNIKRDLNVNYIEILCRIIRSMQFHQPS